MATIESILAAVDKFVESRLDMVLGNNPLLSLAQPIIKKGVMKYIEPYREDIKKYLGLLADKDGNIDIDENLDMITERFNTMEETTVHNKLVGDITMGKGKVQVGIPMPFGPNKQLTFTASDISDFKSMIKI